MTRLDEIHDHAGPAHPEPYVLYAGKLAPNKGVQFLLEAYARREDCMARWSSPAKGRCAPASRPTP